MTPVLRVDELKQRERHQQPPAPRRASVQDFEEAGACLNAAMTPVIVLELDVLVG